MTGTTEMEPFFRVVSVTEPPDGGARHETQQVEASPSTRGPWFDDAQHMGPPSALLVRALERCAARDDVVLTRLTVEILGRVPLGALTVSAHVERAGRTIELVSAEIVADGRAVARAHGWFLATTDTTAAEKAADHATDATASEQAADHATDATPSEQAADHATEGTPSEQAADRATDGRHGDAANPPNGARGRTMAPPDQGVPHPFPPGWLSGYLDALQWSWISGDLGEAGPGRAWARLRVPVVAGEQPSPWQCLAAVADSTNGVSARLDVREWLFVNTDLTIHLHRAPRGEWIGLDADSVIGPDGAGTAFSLVHDEHGPVGRVAQALTVRPR